MIISFREELKRTWIRLFSDLSEFPTRDRALAKLREAGEFGRHRDKVSKCLSLVQIEKRFNARLEVMTGGQDKIAFGKGKWLESICGKKVLNEVVHSRNIRVHRLTGRERLNAIIEDLLQEGSEKYA